MNIEEIKDFIGAYEDDKFIEIIYEAVIEEFEEIIPTFNKEKMTSKQKLLMLTYIQEFYDNRILYEEDKRTLRQAVNTMMINEIYKR